jgi:hypothetical protein
MIIETQVSILRLPYAGHEMAVAHCTFAAVAFSTKHSWKKRKV